MKIYGLMPYLGLMLVFAQCSVDNSHVNEDVVSGTWNLINVSGGFAGIDNDFDKGAIVWKFDAKNKKLIVVKNDNSNSIYEGLAPGTYAYSILLEKDNSYLLINNKEIGGIYLSKLKLVLDQNNSSSGSGADGFILVLEK